MGTLRIDLQAGFQGEPVTVLVNGREVFRNDHVRTDYSVGLADTFTVDVPDGAAQVEVALEKRGLRGTFRQPVGGEVHVGVNVDPSGAITHRTASGGFRYF